MINPIIAKIVKLMALADNQAGAPEGELAAEKAQRLMVAHAVTMADLDEATYNAADPANPCHLRLVGKGWRIHLAWALSKYCNVYCLRNRSRTPKDVDGNHIAWDRQTAKQQRTQNFVYARVSGRQSDIDVWEYLMDICERQIEASTKEWRNSQGFYKPGRQEAYDYRMSAVAGLKRKLLELRAGLKEEDPTGHALVTTRYDAAVGMYRGNLGKGFGSTHRHNPDGYAAGGKVRVNAGLNATPAPKTHRIGVK